MNIFLEEEEIEIIVPVPLSEDRGIVILPVNTNIEKPRHGELEKEFAALDALDYRSAEKSSAIHDIAEESVRQYSHGNQVNEESRARILSVRHNIQDVATTKLMDTLNLLDPSDMEKPRDKIALLTGLGNLVEKMTEKKDDAPRVQLILYAPNQNVEKDYKVIDI